MFPELPVDDATSSVDRWRRRGLIFLIVFHLVILLAAVNLSRSYDDNQERAMHRYRGPKRLAYATLLYSEDFVNATRVLFYSLKRAGAAREIDFLVLVAQGAGERPISEWGRETLRAIGCKLKDVPVVPNPWYRPNRLALSSQFTKLRLWQQYEYSKIVYLDSDMLILKVLFNLSTSSVAAADDYGDRDNATGELNGGLLVLRPNATLYREMRDAWPSVRASGSMEQGFLSRWLPGWVHLPIIYNTPAFAYLRAPHLLRDSTRVIHFNFVKPWEMTSKEYHRPLIPMYDLWWAAFREMETGYKEIPR